MPQDAQPWRFEQLGGPKKVLHLAGYSAPFGRPRQKPVVQEKLLIRQRTVRYPGNDASPTRHVFGDMHEPWELTGRFMSREGGKGYANAKAKEVSDFVRDKQEVTISWGDILSYRGFIESFERLRESEEEIEWKLTVLIDEDNFASTPAKAPTPVSPKDQMAVIQRALAEVKKLDDPRLFKPSILDALSNAISSLNSILAQPAAIVAKLSSFEQALVGEVQRLRGGLGQLRTAFLEFRDLLFATRNDTLTVGRSFTTDTRAGGLVARIDVHSLSALAAIERLDREAAIAERGKLLTSTVARRGDTWESMSTRFYGAPDKADDLRQANGIRFGTQPEPGKTYQVPIPL